MKKIIRNLSILSVVLSSLLFNGCNTDFDVTTDYQITPIVFGLLDQNEEYHYIRINKTFLGQGNAYDFAMVDDSSYFNTVDATITEILSNGSQGRVWQLRDTILENKSENGVFFAPSHKLYYFRTDNSTTPLIEDATYRLDADLNNGKYTVKGTTKLVTGVVLSSPTEQSTFAIKGAQAGDYKGLPITWTTANGAGGRNSKYNVKLVFHYDEYVGGIPTSKSFVWNLAELSGEGFAGSTISVSASGLQFYQMVQSKIAINSSVERRLHTYFEIKLTAGSQDLTNYMLATQPASSLAQSKPIYTNLEGAIGLFSSRYTYTRIKYFVDPVWANWRTLDQNSMRELCEGPYTYQLEFCSNHPADNSTSFRCN